MIDDIQDLVKAELELAKIKTIEKSSDVLASFLSFMVLSGLSIILAISLIILISVIVGHLTGSLIWGALVFLCTMLIVLLVIVLTKNKLLKLPLKKLLIKKFYNELL